MTASAFPLSERMAHLGMSEDQLLLAAHWYLQGWERGRVEGNDEALTTTLLPLFTEITKMVAKAPTRVTEKMFAPQQLDDLGEATTTEQRAAYRRRCMDSWGAA